MFDARPSDDRHQQITSYLDSVFGENLHVKRIESLSAATLGAIKDRVAGGLYDRPGVGPGPRADDQACHQAGGSPSEYTVCSVWQTDPTATAPRTDVGRGGPPGTSACANGLGHANGNNPDPRSLACCGPGRRPHLADVSAPSREPCHGRLQSPGPDPVADRPAHARGREIGRASCRERVYTKV